MIELNEKIERELRDFEEINNKQSSKESEKKKITKMKSEKESWTDPSYQR